MHNISYYDIITPTNTGTTIFDTHMHESYEINFILTPKVEVIIEDKLYKSVTPSSVFIVPPYAFHKTVAKETTYTRKIMYVNPGSVSALAPCLKHAFDYLEHNPQFVLRLNQNQTKLLNTLFDEAADSINCGDELADWKNIDCIGRILCQLIDIHRTSHDCITAYDFHRHNDLVYKIITHINHIYYENITIASISKRYNISQSKLYQIVKKNTGMSLKEYIISLRITTAIKLLKEGLSVTEVSNRVGYDSYAHFIRIFKRYVGMPPYQFIRSDKTCPIPSFLPAFDETQPKDS